MKTGPHSFTDVDGVEWHIVGPYEHVAGYALIRTADAVSLRPIGYLEAAGLSMPEEMSVDEYVACGEITISEGPEEFFEELDHIPPVPPLIPMIRAMERMLEEAGIEAKVTLDTTPLLSD